MASGYGGLYAERGFVSWVRPWPTLGETIVNVVTFANSCNAYIPIQEKEAACRLSSHEIRFNAVLGDYSLNQLNPCASSQHWSRICQHTYRSMSLDQQLLNFAKPYNCPLLYPVTYRIETLAGIF